MIKKGCIVVSILVLLLSFTTSIYAIDVPTLYIKKSDGNLYYEYHGDIAQFMKVDNMRLHNVYSQQLQIRNDSDTTYALYLQIKPTNPLDEKALAFLKSIHMEIYNQGQLLYAGSADALYKVEGSSLKDMAFIGDYGPGVQRRIEVRVQFSATITKEVYRDYFVTSQYETWKQGGFTKQAKPRSYQNQEDAVRASVQENTRGITYEQGEYYIDQDGHRIGNNFAQTTWHFYASYDDVIQEIVTPSTKDTTSIMIYSMYAMISLLLYMLFYKKRVNKR